MFIYIYRDFKQFYLHFYLDYLYIPGLPTLNTIATGPFNIGISKYQKFGENLEIMLLLLVIQHIKVGKVGNKFWNMPSPKTWTGPLDDKWNLQVVRLADSRHTNLHCTEGRRSCNCILRQFFIIYTDTVHSQKSINQPSKQR